MGAATVRRRRLCNHRDARDRRRRCYEVEIQAQAINKIGEGSPHVVDWIERGEVVFVINTPVGTGARTDGFAIRSSCRSRAGCPVALTTMAGAIAAARTIF